MMDFCFLISANDGLMDGSTRDGSCLLWLS